MRVLVTGANGFVGKVMCARLLQDGHEVHAAVRKPYINDQLQCCIIQDIGSDTDWSAYLTDIDIVIHLAARVHVMHETVQDPLQQFRLVNVEGTANLAKQAIAAGVKRFIYISSIKVNGEETTTHAFNENDAVAPQDPYGISKAEAEQIIKDMVSTSAMEYVIIRPPLVYGPGVGGNFAKLMKLIRSNFPLPFANINNKRTMIFVDNLVDLITLSMQHPQAANQLFLAGDSESLSINSLVSHLAQQMKKSPKLFSVPFNALEKLAKLLGKQAYLKRLTGSLEVDTHKAQQLLAWQAPISTKEGLARTVDWYVSTR